MSLKDKIRVVLREHYGEFNTYLEHEYENKISEQLIIGDDDDRQTWATYNQLVLELKNSIKDKLKVKELQYLLTEDKNPNNDCIKFIERLNEKTPELERLYFKIMNFKNI